MKLKPIALSVLVAFPALISHAENVVQNGDFEDGKDTAFWATPPWYNCGSGLNQGAQARSKNGSTSDGPYYAVVNDRYNVEEKKYGPIAHSQRTKYIIQPGDSFTLNYEWRPADDFWQKSCDTVRFLLFATQDDRLGGPVVWSCELTSNFFQGSIQYPMIVSDKTDEVNSFAAGKKLFVIFYGVDTKNGGTDNSPHYARVDNIMIQPIHKKK